jgi:hypothetical protein
METERARERAETDGIPIEPLPADAAPAKDAAPRVVTSHSRCPYCHADIRTEASDWVACEGCLARHHASCWSEHGSCATCHARGALGRVPARARLSWTRIIAAILIGLFVFSLVCIRFYVEKIERQLAVQKAAAAQTARAADASIEQDMVVAKALGFLSVLRRELHDKYAPTDSLGSGDVMNKSLEKLASGLADGAKLLARLEHPVESDRAKRAAEALFRDEPVSTALAILEGTPVNAKPASDVVKVTGDEDELANKLDAGTRGKLEEKSATELLMLQLAFSDQGTAKPEDVERDRKLAREHLLKAANLYKQFGQLKDSKRVLGAAESLAQGKMLEQVLADLGATK